MPQGESVAGYSMSLHMMLNIDLVFRIASRLIKVMSAFRLL